MTCLSLIDLPDGGRLGVERRRASAFTSTRLADVAGLELQIDALHLVDVQLDVGLDGELEAVCSAVTR